MNRYPDSYAFRMALEQRLKNRADESGVELDRLRRYAAFEAFLARLFASEKTHWALKGALALEYRLDLTSRTTTDIDLQRLDHPDRMLDDLSDAAQLKRADFFEFTRPEETSFKPSPFTRRFKVTALMSGREFARLQLDVGTQPLPDQPSEGLTIPSLLEFAGLPAPEVVVATVPFHIAEKLHAYVKPRARENTRVKDLIDLQLLGRTKPIQPREIAAAITTVFMHEPLPIPEQFPKPPASWRVTYRDLAAQQQLATDLEEAHADVAAWLNEALQLVQG